MPSQSEGDGVASDLTHAQRFSDANTERITVRPGYSTPTKCSYQRSRQGVTGIHTEYRMPSDLHVKVIGLHPTPALIR